MCVHTHVLLNIRTESKGMHKRMHSLSRYHPVPKKSDYKLLFFLNNLEEEFIYTFFFSDTGLYSTFLKFKQSIQTVQHDRYIKICLLIKFYIFLNFFTIY